LSQFREIYVNAIKGSRRDKTQKRNEIYTSINPNN